jgi:cell wall-associated NlpC family hydrolase/3D (Asp-Asp-Asp) domain-containing protein
MKRLRHLAAVASGLVVSAGLLIPGSVQAAGQTLTMEATAYGPSAQDNYPYGATDYFGQPLTAGDVAVDPSVIPLRTCLYITGYQSPNLPPGGYIGEADDEGGAIKGAHVDLFMNASPSQVSNFGIQTVHVTILGPADSTSLSGTAACASYAAGLTNDGGGSPTGTPSSTGNGQSANVAASGGGAGPLLVGLTPGAQGHAVDTLQADLELLGFDVTMTGVYDAATETAVTQFEQQHGLPTGGPTTMAFRNAILTALRSKANPSTGAQTATGSGAPSDATVRDAIVQQALAEVGKPYVWGGTTPAGFDCSGLVQWVFAQEGISLPRLSGQQYRFGTPVSKADLEPGDLVFFTTYKPGPSHVGIYIGAYDGIPHAFVAADNPAVGVRIDNLDSAKWVKLFYGAARILPPVSSNQTSGNSAPASGS